MGTEQAGPCALYAPTNWAAHRLYAADAAKLLQRCNPLRLSERDTLLALERLQAVCGWSDSDALRWLAGDLAPCNPAAFETVLALRFGAHHQ